MESFLDNQSWELEQFWIQAESSEAFPQDRSFRRARNYAEKLIAGVLENLQELDELIKSFSDKWDLERMAAVDRNVLRVGTYEMLHCPGVPPVVSIDEAVEIVKDFSSEKSSLFINGILNGIKDSLDRPARKAVEKL